MSVVSKISFGNGASFNRNWVLPQQVQQSAQQLTQQDVQQHQISTPMMQDNSMKSMKTAVYLSSAAALASLVTVTVLAIRPNKFVSKANTEHLENIQKLWNKVSSNADWHDNWIKSLEKKVDEKVAWFDGVTKDHDSSINYLRNLIANFGNAERNLTQVDGKNLLQNMDSDGRRIPLSNEVIKELETIGQKYIKGEVKTPKLNKDSTIYSLTAESQPEKEGGLGEVPVQIARNLTKRLNINNILVRPLSEVEGKATLKCVDDKYTYYYGDKFSIDLDKVMEFDTMAFRNGRAEKQTVEVFYGTDPKTLENRLMFRNRDFFQAKGLYKDSQTSSEKERYAFFPKAVYEFIKIKMDPRSSTSYKIFNKDIYDAINPPSAFLINDWHASAMSALIRLLAPVEAAAGELSKEAADLLKNMNSVFIIHNADYQGTDFKYAGDIINTLFGKYAHDIYTHAKSGLEPTGLQNILCTDGAVNLANMSAVLANKLKPVSPTYAKEIASESERGHALQHIFQKRIETGTMQGASNGWDRSANELSPKNIDGFRNNVNGDKLNEINTKINKFLSDVPYETKKIIEEKMAELTQKQNNMLTVQNVENTFAQLKELKINELNKVLEKLEKSGATNFRQYDAYTYADDIQTIMERRRNNKSQFIQYMQGLYKQGRLSKVGVTDLSKINLKDLDNQITFNCGTRFVSQKGVDILAAAMKMVMKEWPQRYPGKPQPFFAVGGVDGEGGRIKQMMINCKNELGIEGKQVAYMDGFTPNNIFQSGTDFTLFPSHFEPDGAKWESLYKGTPVGVTKVGGHVDSVTDGVNGILSSRTAGEVREIAYRNATTVDADGNSKIDYAKAHSEYLRMMAEDFKEVIFKLADIFYDKKQYEKMVRASIDGNQSWLIRDDQNNIVGGALLGHVEDLGFNLDDFSQIARKEVREAFAKSHQKGGVVQNS